MTDQNAKPKSARRRARELVIQGLYQWRVGGNDEAAIEAYMPEMANFAKADREFFVGTFRGVIAQNEPLTAQISAHIDRDFAELSPIEACILMLGGHYTYAEVPLGYWMKEAFGFARNHYDRIGRLSPRRVMLPSCSAWTQMNSAPGPLLVGSSITAASSTKRSGSVSALGQPQTRCTTSSAWK